MGVAAGQCMVIGIGNPERGDDRAGRAVVERLRASPPAGVELRGIAGEAADLVELLEEAHGAYLIDACLSGAKPGTVRRLDLVAKPLDRRDFAASTHGFGLAEAVELARALGQLPAPCVLYAIEGADFAAGAPMSAAVAAAVGEVAERLRAEIEGRG